MSFISKLCEHFTTLFDSQMCSRNFLSS